MSDQDLPDSLPTYTPDEIAIRYVILDDVVVAVKSLTFIVPMIPNPSPLPVPLNWCFSNDPAYPYPTASLMTTYADPDNDFEPVLPWTTLLVVNVHGQVLAQWADFIEMPEGAHVSAAQPDPSTAGEKDKNTDDDSRG